MVQISLEAYKLWKSAQLKYDYYIVGLIAAIFTYSVSKYTPQKVAFSENSFELLAIIFLFISLYLGIKRLEIDLAIQTISLKKAEEEELLVAACEVKKNGVSHNLSNGDVITKENSQKTIDECKGILSAIKDDFSTRAKTSEAYFNYRNKFMIVGFTTLILANG
ncbi:hypothetical protein [Colwellia sp. E150_009]